MRAVPRQELVPELLSQRDLAREHVGRQQPFEQVVVAAVAVAPREAEHARDGVRLEHRAHGVRRHPEPVGRRPALALEVERRQRALRADPLEHPLGHVGVLGEDPRRVPAQVPAEPGELARRDEGEPLVVRLEDLAALVEQVAPGGVVVGDARVQHEVVAPAGNRERVELDRAELAEDLEHGVGASLERPRRREAVPRDEKTAGGLGGDLHPADATASPGGLARPRIPCTSMHGIQAVGGAVHIDKDLVAASATPLVLAILAEGESYGYAILKRVRELSGGELEWTDGMLYPLLHRLGRLGYVTTEWRTPPEGRRRRYYAITEDGRAALAEQQRQWAAVTRALGDVWRGSGGLPATLGEA